MKKDKEEKLINQYLNIKEAAHVMKLEISTLYAWVHYKKISYTKAGGRLLFPREEIEKYLLKNTYIAA